MILALGCEFLSARYANFFINIYGRNLNEEHFSFGTVIIPYQEINFKSHLNSVLLGK